MFNGAIYVSVLDKAAYLLQYASLADCGPGGAVLVKDFGRDLGPSAELALFLSLIGLVFQPSLSMVVRGRGLIG